jgi:hypothetical protein
VRATKRPRFSHKRVLSTQLDTLREFTDGDSRASTHDAAAVFADAQSVAESSRDVSDPTSGAPTLTPGSVTGSITSRLRV